MFSKKLCWLAGLLIVVSQPTVAQDYYYGQTASGAYYTIAIPQGWQSEDGLVVFNHGLQGYADGIDSPSSEEIWNLLRDGYFTSSVNPQPSLGPALLVDTILGQGYAMAASSYSQTGWAVFDSHIANQELFEQFVALAQVPQTIMLVGGSLGGIVTMRDIEVATALDSSSVEIDGALILCGAVAGSDNWVEALDLRLIYEAVCRNVDGAELPNRWYEVPGIGVGEIAFLDALDKCTAMGVRQLEIELTGDDLNWQLLHNPPPIFGGPSDQYQRLQTILDLSKLDIDFLPLVLGYAAFELPRLINDPGKLQGSKPFSNMGIDYGDENINNVIERVFSLPSSRSLLGQNYTPSGAIGNTKIVAIHTSGDGLVKPANLKVLKQLLPASQLTTAIVDEQTPSHCAFSDSEGLAAWEELRQWVNGAEQPSAQSILQACESVASGAPAALEESEGECRFDPEFEFASSLLSFPRSNRVPGIGANTYNGANAAMTLRQIQYPVDNAIYDGILQPSKVVEPGRVLFDIQSASALGLMGPWQHSARFDPIDELLYVPGVQVFNYPGDSNKYDVYLRRFNASTLELLEYELAP